MSWTGKTIARRSHGKMPVNGKVPVLGLLLSSLLLAAWGAGATPASPEPGARLEHYSTGATPIGVLLADPAALAILEKYVPSFANSPNRAAIQAATLRSMQGYAMGALNDELLAKIDAELAALPPVEVKGPPPKTTTDESRVRSYTLPDALLLKDGRRVIDARMWMDLRRPELLRMFETLKFGRAPGRPEQQHFELFDPGTPVFGGKAIRRQVTLSFAPDPSVPTIQLVEYLPAKATGPVPMLVVIGFTAPSAMIDDPGIRPSPIWDEKSRSKVPATPSPLGQLDVLPFLEAGFGVTAYYYGDVEPDFPAAEAFGIRGWYARTGRFQPEADTWGAIGAWAWSLSRVQDYLETDDAVDADRVAIYGASRLGKTVLWAAARDPRFAAVIACCSGKGGAAIMRRNFGAAVSTGGAYWWAGNYRQYENDPDAMPVDSHELLGLIAPRPVLLQTGRYDHASDPKGEFLSAQAAGPIYALFGKQGLGDARWPPTSPILNDIGYTRNQKGHGPAAEDWPIYLRFLRKHLGKTSSVAE